MRTLILSALLLTSVAAPALAQPDRRDWHDDDRRDDRRDRQDDRRDDHRNGRADHREWNDDRRAYRQDERYARFHGDAFSYPRGFGYRYYGPGVVVPRAFFDTRYYIARPDFYRLPPAFGGSRWIRIGPDALLIRPDGIVVRSVRGLFY